MLSKCQEDKLKLYFHWIFTFLFVFGIALFYKDIGSYIRNININNFINVLSLVKNNLDVFAITIVSLTIIALSLYHMNTNNIVCEERFINGIPKKNIECGLDTFINNLSQAKKLKKKYPNKVKNIHHADKLLKISYDMKESLNSYDQKEFGPMEIYEFVQPLLNVYYDQDKGAKHLSDDLGITIIVPNRKLEDEFRSRFSKFHYIEDRELFPQSRVSPF